MTLLVGSRECMLLFSSFLCTCWLHKYQSNDLWHAIDWAASVQPCTHSQRVEKAGTGMQHLMLKSSSLMLLQDAAVLLNALVSMHTYHTLTATYATRDIYLAAMTTAATQIQGTVQLCRGIFSTTTTTPTLNPKQVNSLQSSSKGHYMKQAEILLLALTVGRST